DPVVRSQPGGVQSYVWQDLRNYYLSRGEPLPKGAFQAVNQLLTLAGQQRREETGQTRGITSSMIAPHLDSRPLGATPEGPQHRVVYLTAHIVEGQTVLSHQTHDFGFALPQNLDTLN